MQLISHYCFFIVVLDIPAYNSVSSDRLSVTMDGPRKITCSCHPTKLANQPAHANDCPACSEFCTWGYQHAEPGIHITSSVQSVRPFLSKQMQ